MKTEFERCAECNFPIEKPEHARGGLCLECVNEMLDAEEELEESRKVADEQELEELEDEELLEEVV